LRTALDPTANVSVIVEGYNTQVNRFEKVQNAKFAVEYKCPVQVSPFALIPVLAREV
jgi:hypothetical protein